MSEKPKPNEKEELVITPGGPRPKGHVHAVGAGEAVYIDKKGEASVGPRQALLPKDREKGTTMGEDFVLTPGGYRHRSLVHRVEPGHAVHVTGDHVQVMNLATKGFIDIPKVTFQAGELPVLGSGWIATSYWNNETGNPITCFRSTWQVPPEPATRSNQLIYLFNGISRFSGNSAILQPVLQWGTSPDGGSQFWAVASWYVHSTGQAFYTPWFK
jgi:hypothetical protein